MKALFVWSSYVQIESRKQEKLRSSRFLAVFVVEHPPFMLPSCQEPCTVHNILWILHNYSLRRYKLLKPGAEELGFAAVSISV